MKLFRHSLITFAFSLLLFHWSTHVVFAQSLEYDPSRDHSVRSVPNTQPDQTHQTFSELNDTQAANQPSSSSTNAETMSAFEKLLSLLKTGGSFVALSFVTGLLFLGQLGWDVMRWVTQKHIEWLTKSIIEYGLGNLFLLLQPQFFTGLSVFTLINSTVASLLQNILKSSLDIQLRIVIGALAGAIVAIQHKSFRSAYDNLLLHFEQKTGWKVGKLQADVLWTGGVALTAGVFLFTDVILSGAVSVSGALHVVGDSLGAATTYVLKESKSAFTETEKECKDREDGCRDIVDKGILLAFNYLPGSMPDLGLADAVIHVKNELFKDSQETVE